MAATRHVKKNREVKRERYLSPTEITQLGQTLRGCEQDGTESPYMVAALKLLILTGCRLGEIQQLKWEYIQGNSLNLPDSKTGAKKVYLGQTALEALAEIERQPGNPYVICGKLPGSYLTDFQRPWRRIRTRADLENVRIHDLRHTYASGAVSMGESLPMIGKLLGHTQVQTTAPYAHLQDAPMHEALAAYGYHGTKDRIYQTLADMNCTALRESIRRIDFATDFLMPEHFQAHIEQVACHSHTKVAPYWGEVENPDQDPNKPTVVTRGRKIESITIGKMPGRQAIIYNKRKAAIEQGKTFWFKVWDIDPTDTTKKIWRVELRAGKRELKDKWQLTTFQDIEDCIGDVFAEATDQIRYLDDHQTDQNVSRQSLHPLWQAVLKAHEENLCDYRAGITPNQLKEIIKERQIEIHLQQIIGNAASIAALEELTDTEIREEFSGQIMQTLQNKIDGPTETFWGSRNRTKQRSHFQI